MRFIASRSIAEEIAWRNFTSRNHVCLPRNFAGLREQRRIQVEEQKVILQARPEVVKLKTA